MGAGAVRAAGTGLARFSHDLRPQKGLPPILAIHGDADSTGPYEHSVKLVKALRDAGDDAELVSVPRGEHGFPKAKENEVYEQNIWPFLKEHCVLK